MLENVEDKIGIFLLEGRLIVADVLTKQHFVRANDLNFILKF